MSWLCLWKDLMKRSHEGQNSHHEVPYCAHQMQDSLLVVRVPPLSQLSPWSRTRWWKCQMWKSLLQVRGDAKTAKNTKCIKVYDFWSVSLPVSTIVTTFFTDRKNVIINLHFLRNISIIVAILHWRYLTYICICFCHVA